MTGKYTLVFDANFWLHKTYFIGQKIKQGKPFNFIDEPEADKNLLLWKLAVDFAAEIRRFEGIANRIVYAIDSSSWRKERHPEAEYKSNRVKSSEIDWSAIYGVHTEFFNALKDLGVIISRVSSTEADDLIFGWTTFLNQQGQNSIIISGDNDLLQLVNLDKSSSANTLYYNKFDKNLHVFPGFKKWLNEDDSSLDNDIFNSSASFISNIKLHLQNIISSNKMDLEEVNVNEFLFRKILIGDSGDNVSPLEVKVKETKSGPRYYKVTDKQANEILEEFKSSKIFVNQSHFFNEDHVQNICEISRRVLKIEKPLEEVIQKWKLNRDLVFLHRECIPQEVCSFMFESIESQWKKTLSANNIQTILNKDSILSRTTHKKEEKSSFSESTIFQTIKEEPKGEIEITKKTSDSFNGDFWDDLLK